MRHIVFLLHCLLSVALSASAVAPELFKTPPRVFAPHVWWHWMNGNIAKDGITADLEAMAEVGVAAATLFDASCGITPGPVKFDTPEFYEAIRHAAKEAKRLGLTLGVANCSGWANSGGPWVTPETSMKVFTVSETPAVGPARFEGLLSRTSDDHGFYGDIAVIAVPDRSRPIDAKVSISGNVAVVTARQPVTAAGFTWRIDFPWTYGGEGLAKVEVSDDGVTYRLLEDLPFTIAFFNTAMWNPRRHTFRRRETFRHLRFTIVKADCKVKVSLADFRLESEQRIEDIDGKTYRYKMPSLRETVIDEPDGSALAKNDAIDLTDRMASDGRLVWNVPVGKWKILRFGYCSNGRLTSKSGTAAGRGLEVDRFDADAVARHFEGYVGKVKRLLGSDGDALRMVLNDSYESGAQNWSKGFEREFERRAGYSIMPFLPILTGRIIGSVAESERFLSDFRSALSDAFMENYVQTLLRKAHEYGMEFYLEPYGNGSFDDFRYARYCDVPMCEFWSSARTDVYCLKTGPALGNVEAVVAAADAWGHSIVGAEAFTAGGSDRWQIIPYSLKCQCDHVYELGVNRIVFHRFTHQPWKAPRYPGMTMGPWGMHFDRTQTWWPEAKEFVRYQTRCQYMLQQGQKVKGEICHRRNQLADWYFVTSTNHFPVTVEKSFPFDGRKPELWYPETGETVCAAKWHVAEEQAVVSIRLPAAGCVFVVFRSDNPDTPLEAWRTKIARHEIPCPWKVRFSSPVGGEPAPQVFLELMDWSRSSDHALRHFSGSAFYTKTVGAPMLKPGERLMLDLGDVKDFATMTVNGKTYPALWKPPFIVDITDSLGEAGFVAHEGGAKWVSSTANDHLPTIDLQIEIKVTNRWPNRLVGDDFLPEGDRATWTSWKHWSKRDKLLKSGLLGPVALEVMRMDETLEKRKEEAKIFVGRDDVRGMHMRRREDPLCGNR